MVKVISVVDDDHSVLRALQRLLTADGFEVETFSSAEDFLECDHRRVVNCLVLDVHLGGVSGFELHELLVASGARVPVIFITAHDDAPSRERARRAGAAGYLPKPFNDESLLAAINKAMEGPDRSPENASR